MTETVSEAFIGSQLWLRSSGRLNLDAGKAVLLPRSHPLFFSLLIKRLAVNASGQAQKWNLRENPVSGVSRLIFQLHAIALHSTYDGSGG
jgi:hypothetical protein